MSGRLTPPPHLPEEMYIMNTQTDSAIYVEHTVEEDFSRARELRKLISAAQSNMRSLSRGDSRRNSRAGLRLRRSLAPPRARSRRFEIGAKKRGRPPAPRRPRWSASRWRPPTTPTRRGPRSAHTPPATAHSAATGSLLPRPCAASAERVAGRIPTPPARISRTAGDASSAALRS